MRRILGIPTIAAVGAAQVTYDDLPKADPRIG